MPFVTDLHESMVRERVEWEVEELVCLDLVVLYCCCCFSSNLQNERSFTFVSAIISSSSTVTSFAI